MRARILVRGLNAQRTGNIHIFLQADLFSEKRTRKKTKFG